MSKPPWQTHLLWRLLKRQNIRQMKMLLSVASFFSHLRCLKRLTYFSPTNPKFFRLLSNLQLLLKFSFHCVVQRLDLDLACFYFCQSWSQLEVRTHLLIFAPIILSNPPHNNSQLVSLTFSSKAATQTDYKHLSQLQTLAVILQKYLSDCL